MQVKDLIEKLQQLPQDLPVLVFGHESELYCASRVEVCKVKLVPGTNMRILVPGARKWYERAV